ncbi:MAG TPA: hypothetical protein VK858_00780, partial [Longimicrobiales bacterium]|nr:hypothetical protein [Longimicrobiales bacterium]
EYDFTYEIDGGGEVNFSQVSVEEFPSNPATELTDCVSTTYKIPVPMDADELVITELTEQFGDGYAELWRIATTGNQGCTATPTYVNDGTTAGYVTIDFTAGDCGQNMKVFFKNRFIPEPPGGGEGCTPGYWRQEHHYDSWSGYTPGQYFDDVFGAGPHITLGEAVQLGGGGENALIRHAVAALLNASSPDVDYAYSAADIIAWTAAALTSGEGIEDLKDDFDEANNAGCDLN